MILLSLVYYFIENTKYIYKKYVYYIYYNLIRAKNDFLKILRIQQKHIV